MQVKSHVKNNHHKCWFGATKDVVQVEFEMVSFSFFRPIDSLYGFSKNVFFFSGGRKSY